MRLTQLQPVLALLALLLVTSSAFAATDTITAITPNAGPKSGNQLVTITGTNLNTVTNVSIGGIAATLRGTNAANTELYVLTGVQAGNGGPADVVLTPANLPNSTLVAGYTYLKSTQNNMLQVIVSVKMKAITTISWDAATPADDAGTAHANTVTDFLWYVRDAELSLARNPANVASYFVDANNTYLISDAQNIGSTPNILNTSPTATAEKIYGTARATGSTWTLGTTLAGNGANIMVIATKDSTNTLQPLTATATQLHPGLAAAGTFSISLQILTPTTTTVLTAQTATVQLTATQ